jgi:hypothetical protein
MSDFGDPNVGTQPLLQSAQPRPAGVVVVNPTRDAELARQRSLRRNLGVVSFMYLVALTVACGSLLCVFVDTTLYWTSFVFYRFLFTALGILVAGASYGAALGACEPCRGAGMRARDGGGGQPSFVPVIVLVLYEVWLLLVLAFAVNDLIQCIATPWCTTVVPTTHPNGYFLTWFIATGVMIVFGLVLIYYVVSLYSLRSTLCGASCSSGLGSEMGSEMATAGVRGGFQGRLKGSGVAQVHRIGKFMPDPNLVFFEPAMKAAMEASTKKA